MKLVLRLEELAMFIGCVSILFFDNLSWWWYLLLLIGPDISMIGYLAGNAVGAFLYNLFHHKGVGILLAALAIGIYQFNKHDMSPTLHNLKWLIYVGVVIFGHSAMDRFFGYGLKYEQGFKYTHLGEIGKKVNNIKTNFS